MEDFVAAIARTNVDLLFDRVSSLPNEGEERYAEGFAMELGGGPIATLVHLQRLGVATRIASYFGGDSFSAFALRELERMGAASITNLYEGSAIPVNISAAILTPTDRTFVSYTGLDGGNRHEASDAELDRAYTALRGAKLVAMQPGYLELYRKLRREGTRFVFDIGWEEDPGFRKYAEYLKLADIFTPNEKEAAQIAGTDDPEKALAYLSETFAYPILTLSRKGCLFRADGKTFLAPPIDQGPCVDATGAGDAFLAGLIYGILSNAPLYRAITYANILGGNAVTALGCLTATMTRERLTALADAHEGDIQLYTHS